MDTDRIIQSYEAKPALYEIPSDDEVNQTFDEVEEVDRSIHIETANKKARIDTHNTLLSAVLNESKENTVNHVEQPVQERIPIINDENTCSNIESVLPTRISPRSSTPLSIKDVVFELDKGTNPSHVRIAFTFEGGLRHKFEKQGELENSCHIEARNVTTGSPSYLTVEYTVLWFSTRPQIKLAIGLDKCLKPSFTYALRLVHQSHGSENDILYLAQDDNLLSIPSYIFDLSRVPPSTSTSTSSSSSSSTAPPTSDAAPPLPATANPTGAAALPLCLRCANEANILLKPCGHSFICEPCCDTRFKQPMRPTILCPHCPADTSVPVNHLIRYTKPDRKCRNMVEKCDNNANTVLSTCGHMVYCDTCVSDYAVCGVLGCSTPYTKADVVIRVVR